jgi:hypothetical protein
MRALLNKLLSPVSLSPFPVNPNRLLRDLGAGGLGLLLLFACLMAQAQAQPPAPAPARPRVVLILCDALTFDDLHDNLYPHLYHLAENGAVALMNTAVSGSRTPAAALLTIATGAQQSAKATDELAYDIGETVREGGGKARDVYRQQTGAAPPSGKQIVHLGISSLIQRDLNNTTLGALLAAAQPPRRAVVCGNADTDRPQRRAALLAIDSRGLASGDVALSQPDPNWPFGLADANVETLSRYIAESDAALFVLQLGDTARLHAIGDKWPPAQRLRSRRQALARLDLLLYLLETRLAEAGQRADVLLVSPYPGATHELHLAGWDRLSPLLAFGPDFPPGLLTSPTTRTAGLVANVDVAPTILRLLNCDVPTAMIGRPMRRATIGDMDGAHRLALLARKDFVSVLDAQAMTPVTVSIAAVCLTLFLCGFVARRRSGPRGARRWAWILVCGANFPVALLLAPILIPPTLLEYGLRIAAWMGALAAVCYLLARPLRLSPPVVACLFGLLILTADILAGQPLQKDSLLSSSALNGVRYYGVGNEYLGVILGIALMGGFAWFDDRAVPLPLPPKSRVGIALIALWLVIMWLLGWPGLGANSGSLVVTTVAFGAGARLLTGHRPTWKLWLACVVLGLFLSFAFSGLDALWAREGSSHAGRALRAATHGRGGSYLAAIAWRKIKMNLGFLLNPFLILDAVITAAVVIAARRFIGDAVRQTLQRRPWLARGLATLPGTVAAALLFKDSGFVTVAFLTGGACLMALWYAFTE